MAENGVIHISFPAPVFDSKTLSRLKNRRTFSMDLMLPNTITCTRCKYCIPKDSIFTAQRENVLGQSSPPEFGVFRFHIKCPGCFNQITIKNYPDRIIVENGAVLNCEPESTPNRVEV